MALEKFTWENGTQIEPAKVEIGGQSYNVSDAQYEGETPLSASNLNLMQDTLLGNVKDNLDDDTKIPSVKAVKGKIIWTNQDTSEQWTTSRQITMNTSDYDCYRVIYFTGASGTSGVKSTGLIPKGYTTQLEFFYNPGSGNNNAIIRRREFAYNDDTHYTVSENMGADGGFPCRPYLVIGYNTGLF